MAALNLRSGPIERRRVPASETNKVVHDIVGRVRGIKGKGYRPRRQPCDHRHSRLASVAHRIDLPHARQ